MHYHIGFFAEQSAKGSEKSLYFCIMEKEIRKATQSEYPILVGVWERSVRATHHFLSEEDLQDIKRDMPLFYLPNVSLYVVESTDRVAGFIGLSGDMIEMLFVDSDCMGQGYGSELLSFAVAKGLCNVDVNEQNETALKFYQRKGFRVIGRDEFDSAGRPYPILHLSL